MGDWYEANDSGMSRREWDAKNPDEAAAATAIFDQARAEAIEKLGKARGFTLILAMEGENGESFQVETISISAALPAAILVCMMESATENVALTHFSHAGFRPESAYPLLECMAASVAKVLRSNGGER